MAINLTEDINHSGGGKIVSVDQSAGSWQSLATKADFDNFTSDTTTKQNLTNGQFFYVLDESQLYKLTVSGFGPFATYTLESASFGGGGSTPSGTISGSQQISDLGFLSSDDTGSFILVSQTSSMSVATASFISDTFISASAARSGFGVGGGSTDISALNIFTGSIQTEVDSLTAETGSYLTSADTSSFVLVSDTSSMSVATASYVSPTFISASAAASGFGAGGDSIPDGTISSSQQITDFGFVSSSVDISALNDFTGSIQTQVDSLIAATGSYLDDTNTILVTQSEPTVAAGGIYFDGVDFYLGQ